MTHRHTSVATSCLSLVVLAVSACRPADIVDDYGPPAGYTVISGTLRSAAGIPVAGADVTITQCTSSIAGYIGSDTTDAAGGYEVKGELPPVGVLRISPDTLRVQCFAFVNHGAQARDSLYVRFGAEARAAPHQTLDLTLP